MALTYDKKNGFTWALVGIVIGVVYFWFNPLEGTVKWIVEFLFSVSGFSALMFVLGVWTVQNRYPIIVRKLVLTNTGVPITQFTRAKKIVTDEKQKAEEYKYMGGKETFKIFSKTQVQPLLGSEHPTMTVYNLAPGQNYPTELRIDDSEEVTERAKIELHDKQWLENENNLDILQAEHQLGKEDFKRWIERMTLINGMIVCAGILKDVLMPVIQGMGS